MTHLSSLQRYHLNALRTTISYKHTVDPPWAWYTERARAFQRYKQTTKRNTSRALAPLEQRAPPPTPPCASITPTPPTPASAPVSAPPWWAWCAARRRASCSGGCRTRRTAPPATAPRQVMAAAAERPSLRPLEVPWGAGRLPVLPRIMVSLHCERGRTQPLCTAFEIQPLYLLNRRNPSQRPRTHTYTPL